MDDVPTWDAVDIMEAIEGLTRGTVRDRITKSVTDAIPYAEWRVIKDETKGVVDDTIGVIDMAILDAAVWQTKM